MVAKARDKNNSSQVTGQVDSSARMPRMGSKARAILSLTKALSNAKLDHTKTITTKITPRPAESRNRDNDIYRRIDTKSWQYVRIPLDTVDDSEASISYRLSITKNYEKSTVFGGTIGPRDCTFSGSDLTEFKFESSAGTIVFKVDPFCLKDGPTNNLAIKKSDKYTPRAESFQHPYPLWRKSHFNMTPIEIKFKENDGRCKTHSITKAAQMDKVFKAFMTIYRRVTRDHAKAVLEGSRIAQIEDISRTLPIYDNLPPDSVKRQWGFK